MRSLLFLSFACLLTFSTGVQAAPSTLAGLWQASYSESPGLSGTLRVTNEGSVWTATAGKRTTSGALSDGELNFAFGENLGRFRGKPAGDEIDGFWIQPATGVNGSAFASPLHLRATGEAHWSGTIAPLASELTFYLSISIGGDGKLSAFLKNPELGLGRGRALDVHTDGAAVSLVFGKTSQVVMKGIIDPRTNRLHLNYPSKDLVLDFVRTTPEQASSFLARKDADYVYRVPVQMHDGWKSGSLSEAGIDEAAITALVRSIAARQPGPDTPYIDSLLIARHGKLVLDEYFNGFDANTPHTLRSASKTFTAMLFGAAMEHGVPLSVQTPVLSLFPELGRTDNPDARKEMITAENLMTMTSGLACDDDDDASPGNEDTMQSQAGQRDWYRYILDLPMVAEPGTKAAYCSGGVNLVDGVIRKAAQRPVLELFDAYFARPLQISQYYANLTPAGDMYGGGGLTLRPRDALKFGELYSDGGVWNGTRVIGKGWIDASTTTHSQMHADSTYGYNWWLFKLQVGDHVYDEWEAGGNGGQFVFVIPKLELVVGITGGNYGRFDLWYKFQSELLPHVILPAIKPRAP
jgi:CubicO group peptidase (beta-lactamase class C family)